MINVELINQPVVEAFPVPTTVISVEVEQGGGGSPLPTQAKTATPSTSTQEIIPDLGYVLSKVTVNPIPSNYGLITYSGYELLVS